MQFQCLGKYAITLGHLHAFLMDFEDSFTKLGFHDSRSVEMRV